MKYLIFIFCLLLPLEVFGNHFSMTINPSTNMLMRPEGKAGTIVSAGGGLLYQGDKWDLSYDLDGGLMDYYEGVQYHYHNIMAITAGVIKSGTIWTGAAGLLFAKFGDITIMSGMNEANFSFGLRHYLNESVLSRSEVSVKNRRYSDFHREDYYEFSGRTRLDRFFQTGTTLRGQLDTGVRYYSNLDSTPSSYIYGLRLRMAQSLGPERGGWIELHSRTARSSDVPDTTLYYDRLFMDDTYKSSSLGGVVNFRQLLPMRRSLDFQISAVRKKYRDSMTSVYGYLPVGGWKELEKRLSVKYTFPSENLLTKMDPSIELYFLDIDSTEKELAYKAAGINLSFSLR